MNNKFDSGIIVSQQAFMTSKFKNLSVIENVLRRDSEKFYFKSVLKVFKKFKSKKINDFGTYYPKFSEGDNYINWNENSEIIYRKIKSRLHTMPSICFIRKSLKKVSVLDVEKDNKKRVLITGLSS